MLVLALLALALILWGITASGSGGGQNRAGSTDGRTPAASITPSPGPSGSGITGRPGGRDTGSSGGNPTASTGASGGSSPATGTAATGTGGTGPVATLPYCVASRTQVKLRSAANAYEPGEPIRFVLSVSSEDGPCKVDLGQGATVLTITDSANRRVWSSGDCPTSKGADLVGVPAGGEASRNYEWDRKPSAPNCATPAKSSPVGSGFYLAEATAKNLGTARTSFRIEPA